MLPKGTDPNAAPATPEVPATPVPLAVPPVQTAVPSPVNVGLPPASTSLAADDPKTDFRRKYDELRGTLKSARSQWDEVYGELSTGIKAGNATISQFQALQQQLQVLAAERQVTQTRLGELQAEADKVTGLAAMNDKLQNILRFPQIVTAAKQVEVEGEDGKKTTKVVNPLMDLALSSTLQGEDFAALLEQLAGQLGPQQAQTALPQTAGNPAEMITTPPPPAGGDSIDELRKQATAAMDAGEYELFYQLQDKIVGTMTP